jgi:hypothetical protein
MASEEQSRTYTDADILPPIPDDYLTEIGRATVEWNSLDSVLTMCLIQLSGMKISDPRAFAIFIHASFPMKMNALGSLTNELKSKYPRLKKYSSVKAKITTAQKGRNLLVHAAWGIDPETGHVQVGQMTARGTIKTSLRNISLKEVKQVTKDIHDAMKALYVMIGKQSR